MTIHLKDANHGPYTLEQIKQLVRQGRLSYRDLARVEGANQWQPLENLIIQDSFRRQREAYIAAMSAAPGKPGGKKSKHANRWLWKPE